MTHSHTLTTEEVGMIRIYMKPGETTRSGWFNSRLLYRDLVLAAKKAGIMNAVSHQTHYGYSNHARVQDQLGELSNPNLTICVELICERFRLEAFCRDHGTVLQDKVVIYKPLEQWRLAPQASNRGNSYPIEQEPFS